MKRFDSFYTDLLDAVENGTAIPYRKTKKVGIRIAPEGGEWVQTWLMNGKPEGDPKFAKADSIICRRIDDDGNLVLNADGKPNEWIYGTREKFLENYTLTADETVGMPCQVVFAMPNPYGEDAEVPVPWGGYAPVYADGYVGVLADAEGKVAYDGDVPDARVYGKEEFEGTYKPEDGISHKA